MNPIDDLFRDKLSNEGMEYQPTYWKAMETMLDEKKNKKPFFFYFRFAFILAGLLFCASLFFDLTQKQITNAPSKESRNASSPSDPASNNKSTTLASTESGNIIQTENENRWKINSKSSDQTHKNNSSQVKNNSAEHSTHVPATVATDKTEMVSTTVSENTATNESSADDNPPKAKENTDFIANRKGALEQLSGILVIPSTLLNIPHQIEIKDRFRTRHPWLFYLAVGYEYDRYSRITTTSSYKTQEKTLNRSGINLNLSATKNNWGIKSGIGFLQLSELTNYVISKENYSFKTSYKMINPNYKQTPGGTRIAIIKKQVDTLVTTSTSIQNPNRIVQFNYLKIPLLFSYQFGIKKLKLYVEAGLINSILLNQKGDYTVLENNQFRIQKETMKNDFSSVLFQTYTSLGLKYNIISGISIYGSYGYSQAINSMVRSYSQKPKINLVSFGLEMKLFR